MKITAVETFHVRHPVSHAFGPSTYYYSTRDALLVKISTDAGLVGWGETAVLAGARALIDKNFAPMLIGQNPLEHRRLWRQMWGPNFGNGLAVGAVDIALHDLWGKALNMSITDLYGGRLQTRHPHRGRRRVCLPRRIQGTFGASCHGYRAARPLPLRRYPRMSVRGGDGASL